MQFDPEETGEARRQRQRDYHAFLDAQVQARRKLRLLEVPVDDHADVEAARFPSLPLSGRLKHQPSPPPNGVNRAVVGVAKRNRDTGHVSRSLIDENGAESSNDENGAESRDELGIASDRDEYLNRLENRLEGEVKRRYMVEKQMAVLGQKVREQTQTLGTELASLREWRNHIEATLSLAPKVQEMMQQQVKALEEEARTRIQADEARAARFSQAVQRVFGEVQNLAGRTAATESGTLQRVAKLEAAFSGEAKGAREATRQLIEQIQELGASTSGSETKMTSLYQTLRLLEKRQEEQQVAVVATRMQEHISRQETQESLMASTNAKLGELRTSLMAEVSSLVGETAKHIVERTDATHAISALRGRVEVAEGQLSDMVDNGVRSLEEELNSVRSEMRRLEGRINAGPVAKNLNTLISNTTAAQSQTQSQLTELQDALSAEITARRRNAVRLAEDQAATKEGNRENTLQMASGLRARCLELEELVARLTRDIRSAQEEMSSQTRSQLTAAQERNSRAVRKLEDGLEGKLVAGIRTIIKLTNTMAQQEVELDRHWAQSTARSDDLEVLVTANKDLLREAEESARSALAATETRRQALGQQHREILEVVRSEGLLRAEAMGQALSEQTRVLNEALEAGDRVNRVRTDEVRAEAGRLQDVASVQTEEIGQATREMARIRQNTDQVAADAKLLRERMHAEEAARMDDTESLRRDLAIQKEASESRMRLWVEDRLRKERTAMEEVLQRAQAHSEIVRALLDEAVKAVSKELSILRAESRGSDIALEEVLDERVSWIESRMTEIDNGAAKKRRLSDLSKETGARIGEVERRVRQAELELKQEVEVKLALSSLVCSVADKDSAQRLDQRASEELQLLTKHKEAAIANDGMIRKELGKTNAAVATMQADLGVAKAWQDGVDKVESRLLAHIEDLKGLAEAAKSAATVAANDASTALREAQAQASLAREASAKRIADATAAADAPLESARRKEAALLVDRAAEEEKGSPSSPKNKETPQKVIDFSALNDELEADSSSSPSTRRSVDDAADADREVHDANALRPKVVQIEEELQELKERLEEGIAEMDAFKQQLLPLVPANAPEALQMHARVVPTGSARGGHDDIRAVAAQVVRDSEGTNDGSEGDKDADRDNPQVGILTPEKKQPQSDRSDDDDAGSDADRSNHDEESGSDQRSKGIAANNSPPLTPASGASYAPILSPKSISGNLSPPLSPQSAVTAEATVPDDNESDTDSQSNRMGNISEREAESDNSGVDGGAQSGDESDDEDGVASEHSGSSTVDAGSGSLSEGVGRDSGSEDDEQTAGGGTTSNHEERDDDDGGNTTARSALLLSSSNSGRGRSLPGSDDQDGSESDMPSTARDSRPRNATPGRSEASSSGDSEAEEPADEGSVSFKSGEGSPARSQRISSGDRASPDRTTKAVRT